MTQVDKLNTLVNQLENKLKHMIFNPSIEKLSKNDFQIETAREKNLKRIHELFLTLKIDEKHIDFDTIFEYKAMNLSAIGLKDEDFAQIRKGKYVQIISIANVVTSHGQLYTKNISLGYYGKVELLETQLKNQIIEFVLRWRYEKSFQQSLHYEKLLSKLKSQ